MIDKNLVKEMSKTTTIYAATPSYDAMVHHTYAVALSETCALVRASGVGMTPSLSVASSLLCKTRNLILKFFMESGATHLLCIDGDLGWPAPMVLAMLHSDKDLICGVYPARDPGTTDGKNQYIFIPEEKEDGSMVTEGELIKALYVPAGFMLIKRVVIERLIEKFPERYANPKNPKHEKEDMHVFFNTELYEGEFWGEDFTFSRLVRESGTDIWVDPRIEFTHAGRRGRLLDSLVSGPTKEAVEEQLAAIKNGTFQPESNGKIRPLERNLEQGRKITFDNIRGVA